MGLCGAVAAIVGEALVQAAIPAPVTIESTSLQSVDGAWLLNVSIVAPPVGPCTRFSHHLIYRNLSPNRRKYVPLGFAQSNIHFPGSSPSFETTLQIPKGIPTGEWWYVDRSIFLCAVWPGFTRVTANETASILIKLEN